MTPRFLIAWLAAAPLATAAGCADSDAPTLSSRRAELTHAGDTGPITGGSYHNLDGSLGYDALRGVGSAVINHHLDVNNYNVGKFGDGQIHLEVGKTYVNGPGIDDRGDMFDYFMGDWLKPSPNPWIDLHVCDVTMAPVRCATADRTELTLESRTGDAILYRYRATMPGETAPTVGGSFVARVDQSMRFDANGVETPF